MDSFVSSNQRELECIVVVVVVGAEAEAEVVAAGGHCFVLV